MQSFHVRVAILVGLGVTLTGHAAQIGDRPWPVGVQQVSEESPPLPPEEALKTIHMPPGYHLELVASEPLIQDPIVIDWDADGRLWAIEMVAFHYPDVRAEREREGLCRVVVLEDTNDDGKMDRRTVFMDGLILPRAVKILDRGVLVGEPPNLWMVRDTNGDLKADSKELVTNRYGRLEGNPEHNANSLLWAMDNWIYTSEHTYYLRLKSGAFEVAPTLPRGQWGATQDDAGRVYRNTNGNALFVDLVPARYFLRNPSLARTRGMYESIQDADANTVFPVRPNRGVNRGYQTGQLREDGTLARYTAAGAPTIYRGDRLPQELYGNAFVAESAGNLVSRLVIADDGTTLRSRRAYERAEFIASTDERFRPVWLSSAPDGTLYVVDMYRGVIQYRDLITEYLRDWIVEHKLDDGGGWGRIYRVVHETTRRDRRPALSRATSAELVATLSHPNGWWRDTAQQLLVQRGDKSSAPALKRLAESAPLARTRLQALWTLDGLDAIAPADAVRALSDPDRDVRTAAVRVSERWLGTRQATVEAALLKRLDDPDWNVRRQLAATLGEMRQGSKEKPLATLLDRHGDDPMVVDAALSGLAGRELAVLNILLEASAETAARAAAIAMVAATIVRGGDTTATQRMLDLVAENGRPVWQRAALMTGTEVAVLGAAPPGSPGPRGRGAGPAANLPCETCPGGRGGPGGDRAFPLPGGADAQQEGGLIFFGSNPTAPPVTAKLDREPQLVRLAATDSSPLGARAKKVLEKIAWPGKPGVPAATVAPLGIVEQQRFGAGRSIYAAQCEACHQDDGRGLPGVGAMLTATPFVLGPPDVTARILLHGKEGNIGLMPALGSAMGDEDVAAVLTYIRRSWGNTGTPVDGDTVKTIRAETAGRTRPWTGDELTALMAGTQR